MPTAPNIGSIPAEDIRQLVLETFKGVDLTSAPTDVALYRSPAAPNMMPDGDGFPVKRRGYAAMRILPGDVYGGHVLRLADGTFRDDFTVSDITRAYAMFERGLMYDWCIGGGNYSLCQYAQTMMPLFLRGLCK